MSFPINCGLPRFQRLGLPQTSCISYLISIFVIVVYIIQQVSSVSSCLGECCNACCEAPEMSCGLWNYSWLSAWGRVENDRFFFICGWTVPSIVMVLKDRSFLLEGVVSKRFEEFRSIGPTGMTCWGQSHSQLLSLAVAAAYEIVMKDARMDLMVHHHRLWQDILL